MKCVAATNTFEDTFVNILPSKMKVQGQLHGTVFKKIHISKFILPPDDKNFLECIMRKKMKIAFAPFAENRRQKPQLDKRWFAFWVNYSFIIPRR